MEFRQRAIDMDVRQPVSENQVTFRRRRVGSRGTSTCSSLESILPGSRLTVAMSETLEISVRQSGGLAGQRSLNKSRRSEVFHLEPTSKHRTSPHVISGSLTGRGR